MFPSIIFLILKHIVTIQFRFDLATEVEDYHTLLCQDIVFLTLTAVIVIVPIFSYFVLLILFIFILISLRSKCHINVRLIF